MRKVQVVITPQEAISIPINPHNTVPAEEQVVSYVVNKLLQAGIPVSPLSTTLWQSVSEGVLEWNRDILTGNLVFNWRE